MSIIFAIQKLSESCRTLTSSWGNEGTQTLIDILAKYNVKTTFFVVGDWVEKYPESIKALAGAGHEVMNHSSSHAHFFKLSSEEIVSDITAIAKITGVTTIDHTGKQCPA